MCPDSETDLEGAFYQSLEINTLFWLNRSSCSRMRAIRLIEMDREKTWVSDLVAPLRYT
jgi:hypothetical protein